MPHALTIEPGQSYPLGATPMDGGVNFCVFSKNCASVNLLLFDAPEDGTPSHVIPLTPDYHKTFYYWHAFVRGIGPGQLYGYRVDGPYAPALGYRFDRDKLLLDPYARAVANTERYDRGAAEVEGDNAAVALKGVVADLSTYDWEGDRPLQRPLPETIIYEMHVRGFTQDPSSGLPDATRGTYAGLIEKLPYLVDLGVTALELQPIFLFDPQDAPPGRLNYWGYSPISFFAPHTAFSSNPAPLAVLDEFRDLVKACHRHGLEVILDVVYNHTAEGGDIGPILSYKGFENVAYYILERDNRQQYANYSGTGNSINAHNSIARRLIRDSLRYWVAEMHVDGFRFDLASVLARDADGNPLPDPPILWSIESDPVLAGTKIIAEAWDAAGLYQVGSFIGDKWSEWNGRYRDDVRRFVKGDDHMVRPLASALLGSPDMYPPEQRDPFRSINFITSHDGFTLNDLVAYNEKHNWANGEENRDGHNANYSWNCGVEGPTEDPTILRLRERQMKNFITILLLSYGTPMLLMGDEVRRSQQGNNNAYCQDNPISWFDWTAVETEADMLRFVRNLIHLRQRFGLPVDRRVWASARNVENGVLNWHGIHLEQPDWDDASHSLAFSVETEQGLMHAMLNAFWEPLTFELPPLATSRRWHRVVDTYRSPPEDFSLLHEALPVDAFTYTVESRSCVVLLAQW